MAQGLSLWAEKWGGLCGVISCCGSGSCRVAVLSCTGERESCSKCRRSSPPVPHSPLLLPLSASIPRSWAVLATSVVSPVVVGKVIGIHVSDGVGILCIPLRSVGFCREKRKIQTEM